MLLTFTTSLSLAATRLQFFPGNQNAMAILTTTALDGTTDEDPQQLMAVMNVPIQNSPLGPGKNIQTNRRDFNLVCGEQRKQCQIVLSRSPRVQINTAQKKMSFKATGAEAKELRQLFYPENAEPMTFITADEKFVIQASKDEFLFVAGENL